MTNPKYQRLMMIVMAVAIVLHLAIATPATPRNGKIAFTSDRDGNREIYVMNADGTAQTRLTNNPGVDDFPSWSPDGTRIAYISQTGSYAIKIVNAGGGPPVQLTTLAATGGYCQTNGFACGLSWSPTGTKIAFTDAYDIVTIGVDGSNRVTVEGSLEIDLNPSWSPDGSRLVFTRTTGPFTSLVYTINADGSGSMPWPGTGAAGNLGDKDPAWSPDGDRVAAILNRFPIDTSDLVIMNIDGTRFWLDFVIERDHASPAWSPDGTRLVFEGLVDPYVVQAPNSEIFSIATDGGSISRLTNSPSYEGHPQWQSVHTASYDFDGDARSDVSGFRPSDGTWYLNRSSQGFAAVQFGLSTDAITPADFDGDGKTDIAIFREGTWWRMNSSDHIVSAIQFGVTGDIPVPADYTGDGRDDLAVYRNGQWWTLDLSNNQSSLINFGLATDKPVAADYDGDGRVDQAVYRNGEWHLNRSTQGYAVVNFGLATDRPVVGDYDGDGKSDPAVYRDGTWYLQRSSQGFAAFQWGLATDVPVAADYNGDGRTDAAVFRDGTWYLQQSSNGTSILQFGLTNDRPVPAAFLN